VRRQVRYCDDGHRYGNRGVNEDGNSAATYHRQLTQPLDAMDRQLAELRKSRAEAPRPETKMEGAAVSRQQAVPTAPLGQSNANRGQESTTSWPIKRVFGEHLICWGCGKAGHIRRNCNQPASADKEAPTPTDGMTKMIHGLDKANVYLAMELRGRRIPCLPDTGCDMTMVPRAVFDPVPEVEMLPTTHRMWTANGTDVQLDREATIPYEVDGRRLDTEALISPDIEEPMIGAEWMKAHRCLWDFRGSEL